MRRREPRDPSLHPDARIAGASVMHGDIMLSRRNAYVHRCYSGSIKVRLKQTESRVASLRASRRMRFSIVGENAFLHRSRRTDRDLSILKLTLAETRGHNKLNVSRLKGALYAS
jgi:hypothetical protein